MTIFNGRVVQLVPVRRNTRQTTSMVCREECTLVDDCTINDIIMPSTLNDLLGVTCADYDNPKHIAVWQEAKPED